MVDCRGVDCFILLLKEDWEWVDDGSREGNLHLDKLDPIEISNRVNGIDSPEVDGISEVDGMADVCISSCVPRWAYVPLVLVGTN